MDQTAAPDEAQAEPQTTAELLARIDAAWSELGQALAALSHEQLTTIRDQQGWAVKDHLVHIITWEQSLLALLQGRDRHQAIGLGDVDEAEMDTDDINAVIFQRNRDRPLEDVRAESRRSHQEVLEAVGALSDADLHKAYSHYQPEAQPYEAAPVVGWIVGNTYEHYQEHITWIRELLGA
jgi:hypothetical protein